MFKDEDEVGISCVATSSLGSSEANFTIKGEEVSLGRWTM